MNENIIRGLGVGAFPDSQAGRGIALRVQIHKKRSHIGRSQ